MVILGVLVTVHLSITPSSPLPSQSLKGHCCVIKINSLLDGVHCQLAYMGPLGLLPTLSAVVVVSITDAFGVTIINAAVVIISPVDCQVYI